MTDPAKFTWIPFYEQLADRLVAWRDRQDELLEFLRSLKASNLPIALLEDKDETGARIPLSEIDPFTFFGSFNRGTTEEARVRILEKIKTTFAVPAPVPSDFSGVPVLNNQKSWFPRACRLRAAAAVRVPHAGAEVRRSCLSQVAP